MMEDASVFLADALNRPFGEALTTTYSGYLHVVPRLLAEIAALFPPAWAAVVLSGEAALVTAGLALVVYTASAGLLPRRIQRVLVSAPMVVLPLAQSEMLNSVAMLRWQLIYTTFWAVLWVSPSRAGRVVGPTVIALAALSDNVVWLFLPLAVARLWQRRDGGSIAAVAALGLGTVAQAGALLFGASSRGLTPRLDPVWAISAYVVRPVPQSVVGARWVTEQPAHTIAGLLPVAAGWLIVAVLVLLAWRRFTAPLWTLAWASIGYSVAVYLFCAMVVGFAGPRYGAPAALLVITGLVALTNPRGDLLVPERAGLREVAPWLPVAALAALLAVVCVVNFRVPGDRTGGPRWSDGLREARIACAAGGTPVATPVEEPHPALPPAGLITADVPVSPVRMGWSAHLPCAYLTRR